jgi:hypothetical protein
VGRITDFLASPLRVCWRIETRRAALLVFLLLPSPVLALDPLIKLSPGAGAVEKVVHASSETAVNGGANMPNRVLPGEPPVRKNYLLPAIEIPAFLLLLNGYDRIAYPHTYYSSGLQSANKFFLHGHWEYDQDTFGTAQLGHPLQGAMMYGFARSSGLNFWESLAYSNAGSYVWMITGETDNPRINGQVTTGNAGAIFGEELYRMGSLVLERGSEHGEKPAAWRSWCAALISPPTGLNRVLFGDRYRWMESRDPATFTRLSVGQSASARIADDVPGQHESVPARAYADFSMDYGLPGKDGYRYIRPLDYFSFEITGVADKHDALADIMTRGLLVGEKYEAGDDYRGIWGIYGSYDYESLDVFRVSNTAVSIGSTAQWWLAKKVALQGTALAGAGLGAAGTTAQAGLRTYRYGVTPQALLALRLILSDRVMLDTTAREYFVSRLGASEDGSDFITRVDGGITVRVAGHQSVSLQYVFSRREAYYPGVSARFQSVGTIGVAYSLIGDPHFGAVEWR